MSLPHAVGDCLTRGYFHPSYDREILSYLSLSTCVDTENCRILRQQRVFEVPVAPNWHVTTGAVTDFLFGVLLEKLQQDSCSQSRVRGSKNMHSSRIPNLGRTLLYPIRPLFPRASKEAATRLLFPARTLSLPCLPSLSLSPLFPREHRRSPPRATQEKRDKL